jgi:hypothetical protein
LATAVNTIEDKKMASSDFRVKFTNITLPKYS